MEITIYDTELRVYETGEIETKYKRNFRGHHIGDWVKISSTVSNWGYFRTSIGKKKGARVHRIVAYAYLGLNLDDPKAQVDHINHDKLDNRVSNLRIVSNQQNQFNNTCKGYTIRENGKYQVRIRVSKKLINLGTYDTEEEARRIYLENKKIYHAI